MLTGRSAKSPVRPKKRRRDLLAHSWTPHFRLDRLMRQSMTMTRLKQKVAMLPLVGGIGIGLAASILGASVSRAQVPGVREDAEARAIIDKAIKAHGGADKLSRFKAVS